MLLNLFKSFLMNTLFAAFVCGSVYGITVLLIHEERYTESYYQRRVIAADYEAVEDRATDAQALKTRMGLEYIPKADLYTVLSNFFADYFPSERMLHRSDLVNQGLNWKLGAGWWFIMSEGLLARFNRTLTENSLLTTMTKVCLPFTLTVVLVLAFASAAKLVFDFFSIILTPFMRFNIIRANESHQKKLLARDIMATILSSVYAVGSAFTVAHCMKRRMDIDMKKTLFSLVFRLNGMYHPQHANDEKEMTLFYAMFLFSISAHLAITKILIFHGIGRTYQTWVKMNRVMPMEKEKVEDLLERSKDKPKHDLVFHAKYE